MKFFLLSEEIFFVAMEIFFLCDDVDVDDVVMRIFFSVDDDDECRPRGGVG